MIADDYKWVEADLALHRNPIWFPYRVTLSCTDVRILLITLQMINDQYISVELIDVHLLDKNRPEKV